MIARFFCLKAFRSAMYVLHVLRNIDPRRRQQIPWAIRMATASSTLKLKRCRTGRQHQPLHSYIQLLHATDCYSLLLYLIASVSANHPDFAWCWVSFVSTRDFFWQNYLESSWEKLALLKRDRFLRLRQPEMLLSSWTTWKSAESGYRYQDTDFWRYLRKKKEGTYLHSTRIMWFKIVA